MFTRRRKLGHGVTGIERAVGDPSVESIYLKMERRVPFTLEHVGYQFEENPTIHWIFIEFFYWKKNVIEKKKIKKKLIKKKFKKNYLKRNYFLKNYLNQKFIKKNLF